MHIHMHVHPQIHIYLKGDTKAYMYAYLKECILLGSLKF